MAPYIKYGQAAPDVSRETLSAIAAHSPGSPRGRRCPTRPGAGPPHRGVWDQRGPCRPPRLRGRSRWTKRRRGCGGGGSWTRPPGRAHGPACRRRCSRRYRSAPSQWGRGRRSGLPASRSARPAPLPGGGQSRYGDLRS